MSVEKGIMQQTNTTNHGFPGDLKGIQIEPRKPCKDWKDAFVRILQLLLSGPEEQQSKRHKDIHMHNVTP